MGSVLYFLGRLHWSWYVRFEREKGSRDTRRLWNGRCKGLHFDGSILFPLKFCIIFLKFFKSPIINKTLFLLKTVMFCTLIILF